MRCPDCGAYVSRDDGTCIRCGASLNAASRLPVQRTPSYPTLWQQAAPVLARGAALVALGVVAELALSTLARGALRLPSLRRAPKSRPLPTRRDGDLPEGAYVVSETVILRRLIFRR